MKPEYMNARRQCAPLVAIAVSALFAAAPVGAESGQAADRAPMLLAQATKAAAKSGAQASAGNPARAKADLEALTKAAKAEGEVTIYSAAPDSIPRRTGAAFTKKYGIKTSFIRLSTAPLAQRYFAEGEAGTFAADIVVTAGGSEPYTTEGIKKGWIEPIAEAKLPVLTSGEFPERFNDGLSPIVQISPWMIAYNKDLVKGADIPKDWPDMLDPKWKGKIILADPRVGSVFTQFWLMLHERYGDGFFTLLRAQEPRRYPGGIPAIQGLAAGEGSIYPPVIASVVTGVKDKGAPVDTVTPEFTTGTQFYLVLTARGKAKHPNAARLLANYIMSPEGNQVFNDEPGLAGVYDTKRLPKQFVLPKPVTKVQIDNMAKLLGY
jgi:iron(III) transport system substrate-binding protein